MSGENLARRKFLTITGSAAAAVALYACGASPAPTPARRPTSPSVPPTVVAANVELGGRDRLLTEIDGLPDTYVKKLLQERIKPYFRDGSAYPFTLERGDFKFRVHGAEVAQEKIDTLGLGGRASPRSGVPSTRFRPENETKIRVPLLFGPTEAEANRFGIADEFKLPDNSGYFVEVRYPVDRDIYDGLKPAILIRTPKAELIPTAERKHYAKIEQFVYIKEAASLLFYDLVMEETFNRMKQYHYAPSLFASGPNGREEIEMVNKALTDIGGRGGRFLALADLSGYYLALKAFESDPQMKAALMKDSAIKRVLPSLSSFNFDNNPKSVIETIANWSLSAPNVRGLHYLGNLDQFPLQIEPSTEFEFAIDSSDIPLIAIA